MYAALRIVTFDQDCEDYAVLKTVRVVSRYYHFYT